MNNTVTVIQLLDTKGNAPNGLGLPALSYLFGMNNTDVINAFLGGKDNFIFFDPRHRMLHRWSAPREHRRSFKLSLVMEKVTGPELPFNNVWLGNSSILNVHSRVLQSRF